MKVHNSARHRQATSCSRYWRNKKASCPGELFAEQFRITCNLAPIQLQNIEGRGSLNIFIKRTFLYLLVMTVMTSCNNIPPTVIVDPTIPAETDTSGAIAVTETNTALPTFTAIPVHSATATPSPRPSLPTEISTHIPGGIVFYYFVNLADYAPPEGSVAIMADSLILAPAQLDIVYGSDITADLRSALEAVLNDERNYWTSDRIQINHLAFSGGHVDIRLEGEYYAVAPVVLTAARAQILMTLFANAAVQSARVTINGDNIANISISHSMDAKPADYTYTRAEVETFMAENASAKP